MRVRLLGPVDVTVSGTARSLPGLRRKAVLAALALQPGEAVSADRLIDIVWADAAPATALNTLQSHISQLRRILGRDAVLARSPGYLLNVEGEGTDVLAAERLVKEGTRATDPVAAAAALRAAAALWRGRSLADLTGLAWFDDHARRLDLLLLQARQALVDARLALGEHAHVVPELKSLARQHPLHEQLHGLLMLALYRCGRQSEALEVYERMRRTLDEDLGMRPSQALRDLHTAILRQDPALAAPAAVRAAAPVAAARLESGTYRAVVPAQLPPTLRAFTGRRRELARLDALLSRPPGGDPRQQPAVVVSAVSGTAGIGKTSLALHWAHQVASQYPDGQLYVNLCGFHPTAEPVDPAEAVRGFLDALGVPPQRVPSGIDGQIGLYRSLLAGKRVLVLLDNAATADQVRPLLPGAAGCLVVVTSRNQLTGLVATDGAYPLTLDLLTRQEARQLLAARLGADRVAAEAEAVEQIVAGCAGLPLALAIAAARAAHQPRTPLAVLAKELSADGDWLDALDAGEPSTGVRAVFSWSYDRLSAPAARMFRLLGLLPLLGVGVGAAASLAGVPVATARSTLAELVRAQLLSEDGRERYTNHDLLRAYALELAHSHDSAEDRQAALHRVLDHYLHTAFAAAMLLNPTRASPIDLPAIHPEATAQRLSDRGEAQAWFGAEYPALFAAIDYAAGAGFPRHAWQLAWTLQDYCDWQGHWHSMLAIQETAVAAARLAGDPSGEAWAQRGLGIAHMLLSRHDEAFTHLTVGFEHYRRLGDEDGVAHSHHSLGVLLCRQDRYREAVQHARQALEIYRRTGNRDRLPAELNQLGWYYAMLGDYQQTLTHCQQALTAANQIDDQYVAAAAWDSLGYAHHHLGDHTSAIGCYRHGRELRQAVGDRYYEADTLVHLGDAYLAVGQRQAARDAWHQAWEILGELDHPDAGEVIDRIRTLDAALR